jgi:hypothetical protein
VNEDVLEGETVDGDRDTQLVGEGDLAEGHPREEGLKRGGKKGKW